MVHTDHLGSVRLLTNIYGQPRNTYDYSAFGDTDQLSGTIRNDRTYTGHLYDPEYGLTYMVARYYDAVLGRFISPDSIVPDLNPQSLNRYSYVLNNPISRVDPTGHRPLTSGERGLTPELDKSINYDLIDINVGFIGHLAGAFGYQGTTIGNNIHMAPNSYSEDISKLGIVTQAALVEEIFHAWDFQNRSLTGFTTRGAASEHFKADTYNYTFSPNKSFFEYSFEHRAGIFSDNFLYSHGYTPTGQPANTPDYVKIREDWMKDQIEIIEKMREFINNFKQVIENYSQGSQQQ